MRHKKTGLRRKAAPAAHDQQAQIMASPDQEEAPHRNLMEALDTILPTIAHPELHSSEELITAIAKMLRLKDITMEVLRDASIGAYVRDLCDHPSVQVSSAARIAIDCFQTTLFEWAGSTNWSREVIAKACLDADREIRHKACKSASLATISSLKQPIVLKDDMNINNNNTSDTNIESRNDFYTGNSMIDPSSDSKDKEDPLYTPTEPSMYSHKRVYPPEPTNRRTRLHVHFPSPSISCDR